MQQGLAPPPTALNCIARRRGQSKEAFKYKKGDRLKRLKFLDPKRQIQTANRHDPSAYRQIVLALLTFNCHTSVC